MKTLKNHSLGAQKGFTLIELVVVIVILGILAATAAPKFIDLTGDAKGATVQAIRASVESANTMIHAKALVKNELLGQATLTVNGTANVGVNDGWPDNSTTTWGALLDVDVTSTNPPFTVITGGTTGTDGVIVWYPTVGTAYTTSALAIAAKCYVSYTESGDKNIKPVIVIDTDLC